MEKRELEGEVAYFLTSTHLANYDEVGVLVGLWIFGNLKK